MNMALAKYNKGERENFEDIQESLIIVRNHLDLLAKIFTSLPAIPKRQAGSTAQNILVAQL